MGVQRDRVAAYRTVLAATGAKDIRMPMSTPDAIGLASELAEDELRHPHAIGAAKITWDEIGTPPPDAGDFEGQLRRAKRIDNAATVFWDAFEGQPVDGVEIIRRR